MQRFCQSICISFDLFSVVALKGFLKFCNSIIDFLDLSRICLVAKILDGLFSLINQSFCIVLCSDSFLAFLVFCFMSLGIILHLLDFFIGKACGRSNIDLLFLACAKILSGYVNNAVGIDIKCYLDLRYSARSRRNVAQFEAAECLVVGSHRSFTLKNMDVNRRLVVSCCGEYLGLGSRDGGISLDHGCEYAAQCFNTQGKRGNVEEENVLDFAFEYAGLNSCADCNGFIRVDSLGWFLAELVADQCLYCRDTGRTADEENLINIGNGNACISHSQINRFDSSLNEVVSDLVEFSTGQCCIEVYRLSIGIHGNEWKVDIGGHNAGKFDLCLFAGFLQSLVCHRVTLQFKAVLCLEFISNPVHDTVIEVIAAQMAVAVGSSYFEYAVSQIEDGYIECAAAQIINEEAVFLAVFDLVKAVSQRGCGRFVDDTEDIQSCNLACVLGCLTLSICEVCRAGNNCIGYLFTEVCFCIDLQLLKDHSGNFLWCVFLAVDINGVITAHMTFDGNDGTGRVGYSLALSQLADESFAGLGEADNGWCQTGTFRIRNNDRFAAFHNCDYRVGST